MKDSFQKILRKFIQPKYLLIYSCLLFAILLARNPYSQRTLIPNLEPYPDSLHYIVPARSLISGEPFRIVREGRQVLQSVPPLYSISLIPFYLVNFDVRTFYFANVALSFLAFFIFYLIVKRLTKNPFIIGLTLFVYVTNYYVYWYPQWAMAENLILPIFLFGVYLLIYPISNKNIILAGLIPGLIYATKYALLPFSALYFLVYLFKFVSLKKRRLQLGLFYFGVSVVAFVIIAWGFQYFVQGLNPISRYIDIIVGIFQINKPLVSDGTIEVSGARGWFSEIFFKKNLPLYTKGLLGQNVRFLWDYSPVLPKYIIYIAWLGLIAGCLNKKTRYLSFALMMFILPYVLIISTFSTFDMRYVYQATSVLLIGFTIALNIIMEKLFIGKRKKYFILIIAIFSGIYMFQNAIRIKNQIVLNLKYAETPWYYISVLKLNEYFVEDLVVDNVKPVVISPMPPFYIDFYSNGNYQLLPLSKDQEFRFYKEESWGPGDYSDMHLLYKKFLKEGRQLYLATYGLGVEENLHRDFNNINDNFKLTLLMDECYTQCRIYKVELKSEN